MLKIALVGNIASGKSIAEKYLANKGFQVYDSDKIAHEILENSSDEIIALFSNDDILTNSKIDRKKLAKVVFEDKSKLSRLESVIYPKIKQEFLNIFNTDLELVFISVPQLFESGLEDMFDKIVFISSEESIRLKRLMDRNKFSEAEALIRIKAQQSEELKIKKSDYVVLNNSTLKDFETQLLKMLEDLSIY